MTVNYFSELWSTAALAVGNHLWQSTVFAVVAGLLTLVLRKNHARARYWLWVASSAKFLIPFSLLVGLGSHLPGARGSAGTKGGLYFALEEVSQPFTQAAISMVSRSTPATVSPTMPHLLPALLTAVWLGGFFVVLFAWYVRWRRTCVALREAVAMWGGREVEALRRLERLVRMPKQIELRMSRASLEPGIFGIARPVMVWPERISRHLDDLQLQAIVAHEVCHVRRRDNLAAAIHLLVEAIFWFHPLTWWLGARLLDERERACDEEVLEMGTERQVYAESILKTCEFCLGSPLACVSGITGADLKERIVHIMTRRVARRMDFGKKLLLAVAALVAIALPMAFGAIHAAQLSSRTQVEDADSKLPKFEVATIRLNKSSDIGTRFAFTPDGFTATNVLLTMLLKLAYGVEENQIVGLPRWVKSERFDITAKVVGKDLRKLPIEQRKHMIRPLLADRFQLRFHEEEKNVSVYTLVIAKNGSKLQPSKSDGCSPLTEHGQTLRMMGRGYVLGLCIPMELITQMLTDQLGRPVIDRTGLKGDFDFTLHWTPDEQVQPSPGQKVSSQESIGPDSDWPTLLTAVNEQLGLQLKSEKGPAGAIAIDHLEEPSGN
jgi:bla regulator protein blaR1